MYTKPVDCTSVNKTSLLVINERNVHTWTEHQGIYMDGTLPRLGCLNDVQKLLLYKCTKNQFTVQVTPVH